MNYLIVVSYMSLFILGFCDNLRGPLFPEIIRYFNVSDTLGAGYFAVTSIVAFFATYAIRKKRGVFFLLKILNLGILTLGLSLFIQSFSPNYMFLMFGVFFFGISFAFLGVSQNNLVIMATKPENRSRVLTGLYSMQGIASLISPLYVATNSELGWKSILFKVSLVPISIYAILFILNRRHKERWKSLEVDVQETGHIHLTHKERLICFVISLYVMAEILLSTRIALYMRRYFDSSLSESSFYVTLLFVFMLIGRLIVSFYPPKISLRIQLIGSLILSVSFILIGMYFSPIFLALCGFTMSPFYPLAISYISELSIKKSNEIVSETVAIQSLFIVLMHIIVGRITDLTNLRMAFWVGPISMLLALIILMSIKKEYYK